MDFESAAMVAAVRTTVEDLVRVGDAADAVGLAKRGVGDLGAEDVGCDLGRVGAPADRRVRHQRRDRKEGHRSCVSDSVSDTTSKSKLILEDSS